jgi:hypothetical protein
MVDQRGGIGEETDVLLELDRIKAPLSMASHHAEGLRQFNEHRSGMTPSDACARRAYVNSTTYQKDRNRVWSKQVQACTPTRTIKKDGE